MHKTVRLITALAALLLSSFVFAEAMDLQEGSCFVEGSYIVTFKEPIGAERPVICPANKANLLPFPEHSSGQSKADLELTLGTNGEIKYIFDTINATAISMDAQEAQRLSADPRVRRVDQDRIVTAASVVTDYNGIWQDQSHPERYYSIRVKENRVILIDLAGLETSGNTLQSSYSGVLAPGNGSVRVDLAVLSKNKERFYENLSMVFESEDKGFIRFLCNEPCTVSAATVSIRKIF